MNKLSIGIIDDIMTEEKIDRYNRGIRKENYTYVYLELKEDIDKLIDQVIFLKLDGLVIDQKLNGEMPGISYNGTDFTKKLNEKLIIPYIFWTSNKDFTLGLCQSREVESIYNHGTESGLTKNSIMIKNLCLKIEKRKKELREIEERFNYLLEKNRVDGQLNSNDLLELEKIDTILTKSFFKESNLQDKISYLQLEKMDDLLENLEKIMEESYE